MKALTFIYSKANLASDLTIYGPQPKWQNTNAVFRVGSSFEGDSILSLLSTLQMVLKEVHILVTRDKILTLYLVSNLIDLKCNNIHLIMFMVGVCTVQ